jgi:hypothetical protein
VADQLIPVVVSVLAAGSILGTLFALPFAAALRVLTLEIAAPALRRWTGTEAPNEASVSTSHEQV